MQAYLNFGSGTVEAEAKLEPLPHHKAGLQYTASGYGPRIPTPYMIRHGGRWRRVYAACYGNAASTYIGPAGQWLATVDIEH